MLMNEQQENLDTECKEELYMTALETNISDIIKRIKPIMIQAIENIVQMSEKISKSIYQLAITIKEAQENPNSFLNYIKYERELSSYYWVIPFNMDNSTLKDILEKVKDEKEFDEYMKTYFTKERIEELFNIIEYNISSKYKTIFKQIKKSFFEREYALINIAIISIIDNELSYFLKDKAITKRVSMLEPIIIDIDKSMEEYNMYWSITLLMLNNNINILFGKVDFNNIQINTHKKTRRHSSQHGKVFNNKKIDCIMLLNTF